ncbi:MAG: tyrosine-type recombinase/integrase [Kofleriaceae bacterium]
MYRIDEGTYWVRAKALDQRTGKKKEVEKLLEGVNLQQAAQIRAELFEAAKNPAPSAKRMRVREYAKDWWESKKLRIDASTAKTYDAALEKRILPWLGDYYYDALTSTDVQKWVDNMTRRGWRSEEKGSKGERKTVRRTYTRKSMEVWFRVLRTMSRDAMVALDLTRDPTMRVSLPEGALDQSEPNALSPEQLIKFLAAMKAECPRHYALVAVLAYTGLRFCHASALRWEDWDRKAAVIKVVRKNFRGVVGPVSRKKQAPKEYPVEPELQEILLEHYEALRLDVDRRLKKKGIEVLRHPSAPLDNPLMFPANNGELRTANSLDVAFAKCKETAGITKRFTVHGLRYTFTDLVRRANVDAVVRRALTGHVTEEMQRHYSTVGIDEKRAAIAGVLRLVPPSGGSSGGSREAPKTEKAVG